MLVYDTTNSESFKALPKWSQFIKSIKDLRGSNGILVATKTDQSLRRQVTQQEGEEYAKQHNLVYFECAAATNTEVEAPFYYMANAFHGRFEEQLHLTSKIVADLH
ncbi:hypothetical protein BDEG_23023 [Batrachochytrium dendrobatidis JEL423]|nr:hypothetical protein BDEG_23023 [Batrachochytrium dendrobatidis JEL423]